MNRIFVHRIDRENRIIYVNGDWLEFAVENRTPALTREAVMNRPLLDFIEDKETRDVFKELFVKVRGDLTPVTVPFRCDSPDCIRVMEMEVIPLIDGEIQFNCRMVRQEERAPIPLLDPSAERGDGLLTICSWCKKIKVQKKGWLELEDAIRALDLFGEERPPRLTGGICPECNRAVFGKNKR